MRETVSGNVKHFYHRNQQYSITALTDNSGNTAERYAYTANGVLTIFNATGTQIPTSALFNRYTYTGREWDNSLVMYYFRARWFDPIAGRFANRDPLAYIDGMSLYRGYFELSGRDPLGLVNDTIEAPGTQGEKVRTSLGRDNEGRQIFEVPYNWPKLNDEYGNVASCYVEVIDASGTVREIVPVQCPDPLLRELMPGNDDETYGEYRERFCKTLASACDALPYENYQPSPQLKACQMEAELLCRCLIHARKKILELGRGRPALDENNGPVCTDCRATVTESCSGLNYTYFGLEERNRYNAFDALPGPPEGHTWHVVYFKTLTKDGSFKAIVTVDYWSNFDRWWMPGLDSMPGGFDCFGFLPTNKDTTRHPRRKNTIDIK
jgi:RHS repeat-associated protein